MSEDSIGGENGHSNVFISGEATSGAAGFGGGDDVSVNGEPVNQQVDAFQSVKDNSNDAKGQEDGGRDDMFVDCSEEIEASGAPQTLEGSDGSEDPQLHELNNGTQVQDLMDEMKNIRDKLARAVAQEGNISREYEEEKAALKGELLHLHSQLKVLNGHLWSLGRSDSPLDQHPLNVTEKDKISLESDLSPHEMITECSKLLEDALAVNSQTQNINRDLQASIQIKDLEIRDLNQKLAESSVSHDVIFAFLSSAKENSSQSFEAAAKETANRILDSLPVKVCEEGSSNEHIQDIYTCLEGSISLFIAKHNQILSELDQLRRSLTEIAPNSNVEDEAGLLSIASRKLLELKETEVDLEKKLRNFEEENTKMVEELNENKAFTEKANSDIIKLNTELEQEKARYANTKEKLGLAVTKGKALVQQRDSLKQLLADKTSELEKCSIDLQEKSSALEAAEKDKILLQKLEDLSVSLEESITQKDATLQKCAEILSEAAGSEEIQSMDIIENLMWLRNERDELKITALEFQKCLGVLSTICFPGSVPSNELNAQIKWLVESLQSAKEEALQLQNGIAEIREKSSYEIDRITTSFLAEAEEKNYLQLEFEDIRRKYEEIVEKENYVSAEKAQMLDQLLEAAGITLKGQAEINSSQSGTVGIVNECISKIKAEVHDSLDSAHVTEEIIEKLVTFLYVRDQELMLYAGLLEEDLLDKGEVNRLSNEVADLTRSLGVLRDENDSLLKELNRSEEKATLLREKLSMAVKKGKGLVQDRENLKGVINEKNSEIERLKSDLQQQAATCSDLKDQIEKLMIDVDRIQKLEANIDATKEQKNQLEQYLLESNNMLQNLVESLDGIEHHGHLAFETPVDKVKWLARCLTECQAAEVVARQELETLKHETHTLTNKLLESETALKSSEDALAEAENKCSQLLGEKSELEHSKVLAEKELQSTTEELHFHESKFSEVSSAMKSHVDSLAEAENKISQLLEERAALELAKAQANSELHRTMEELSTLGDKFAEVSAALGSHEDALTEAENKSLRILEEKAELERAKALADQELQKTMEELHSLRSKFAEFSATLESHDDSLAEAENKTLRLLEEKAELEHAKALADQELQRTTEELHSLKSKFAEVSATMQSHEDALLLARENASELVKEKEHALTTMAAAEMDLQTMKEENAIYVDRLSDAEKTIRSLEDALSHAQKGLSLLSEENSRALHGRSDTESEIKNIKEEAESLASKLSDATMTIKSLEDAVANSESTVSNLVKENETARLEISELNSKLDTCLQELAVTRDSTVKKSQEISDQYTHLKLLLRNDTLSSILQQCFEKKIGSLRDLDLVLNDITDHLLSVDPNMAKSNPVNEDDTSIPASLEADFNSVMNLELINGGLDACIDENGTSLFHGTVEGFHIRDKTLADRVDTFSHFLDNLISSLLKRLRVTKDGLLVTLELVNSLKEKVTQMELDGQTYDNSISALEKDNRTLLSACSRAINELKSDNQSFLLELMSIPLPENLRESCSLEMELLGKDVSAEDQFPNEASKQVETAEKLLRSVRHTGQCTKLFQKVKKTMIARLDDLQNELKESKRSAEMYLEERDLSQNQISKLETDVGLLQKMCNEQRLKVEQYETRESMLEEREVVSSGLQMKVQDMQDFQLSASESRAILDKVEEVDIPDADSELNDSEIHFSVGVHKLLCIIDTFTRLQHQLNSEVLERRKLQSTLERQTLEIQDLKDEVSAHVKENKETEKIKNELSQGLKDIVQKLGDDELLDAQKAVHVTGLLAILQRRIMSSLAESENLRSKNIDLSTKLLGAQKVADDLSGKVKLLEDSNRAMVISPETANDKGVLLPSSLANQSEISDVQDMGPIGKTKAESSVQFAAHPRTLRKGSSDHLAISIEPESERLVNQGQDDEDKGHVFKSLNTSGLIPRQGKLVADRIDGLWVSGGRVLMSHPRARLGLIAYSLLLHFWFLVTIF